ncbi:MAG: DUF3945 domain-containing protein, partial [Verrucomicrobiaceae bacterium]
MDHQETVKEQPDMLLVRDMEKNTISAVKEISPKGKLRTVPAEHRNQNQFMRINQHGDAFSNFFSNFLSQLKNPTRFAFFLVNAAEAPEKAALLQRLAERASGEEPRMLSLHEALPSAKKSNPLEKSDIMETTQNTVEAGEYRYTPEQIDWQTMNSMGLSRERLEKMNLLEPLLKGYKTDELVPVTINLGTAVTKTDARLSLQAGDDGKAVVSIHGIRREPNLNFEFFGHKFTEEDKQHLRSTGNMGRVVDLTNSKTGEPIPSIVSIDRLTNEIIALRAEYIRIPDEIKGVKLDDAQRQALMEGKPLYLEAMISKKGTEFSATVQFNADKRYVEFLFDRTNTNKQAQNNGQHNELGNQQHQAQEAPRTFRGKELTDGQHKDFKNGQTIYIDGLMDKKGQPYQGYITFNKEDGKTNFEFPNQYKERVNPTEAHKAQTAVNSEGKTNEAT